MVEGTQTIEILDRDGDLIETREIDLEFSLVPPETVVRLSAAAGFRPRRFLGDYRGAEFDEHTSPALIIEFERE